jgi:hypothetical protein
LGISIGRSAFLRGGALETFRSVEQARRRRVYSE